MSLVEDILRGCVLQSGNDVARPIFGIVAVCYYRYDPFIESSLMIIITRNVLVVFLSLFFSLVFSLSTLLSICMYSLSYDVQCAYPHTLVSLLYAVLFTIFRDFD